MHITGILFILANFERIKKGVMSHIETTDRIEALPRALAFIATHLKEEPPTHPGQMVRLLRRAEVRAEDLAPWADFDHPVQDSYGRKLVYKEAGFEIMVMSWRPGDFSAIHDHGFTQWGAVQVFGPAEHATFREEDEMLYTLARWRMEPGEIVGVSHKLVHQMGNPTRNTFFLSLHVYGTSEPVAHVTGMARLFDLETAQIHRVNGGVFFALPPDEYVQSVPGPKGDFATRLRHMVELTRRLHRTHEAGGSCSSEQWQRAVEATFDPTQQHALEEQLAQIVDCSGHVVDSVQWRILNHELRQAARLQADLTGKGVAAADAFEDYARMYDDLICRPSLDQFMRRYLFFFQEKHMPALPQATVLSLGCGTGLVERFMIDELGVIYDNLFGIDISEAMVREARTRIAAEVGDILSLDPGVRTWDVAYAGLNVLQYLPHQRLKEAIHKIAAVLKPGGWFVGDFITPDHIRWYPNVMRAANGRTVSLRSPKIVEEGGINYQESEIINIHFGTDRMYLNDAGKHRRYLPPLYRLRKCFEDAFGPEVYLYDAVSLEPIPEWADSCPSTRYVLMAQKKKDEFV